MEAIKDFRKRGSFDEGEGRKSETLQLLFSRVCDFLWYMSFEVLACLQDILHDRAKHE